MTSSLKSTIARWFAPAASVRVEPELVESRQSHPQQAGAGRPIPEIHPDLWSAITRLRTSERATEEEVVKAFSRFGEHD